MKPPGRKTLEGRIAERVAQEGRCLPGWRCQRPRRLRSGRTRATPYSGQRKVRGDGLRSLCSRRPKPAARAVAGGGTQRRAAEKLPSPATEVGIPSKNYPRWQRGTVQMHGTTLKIVPVLLVLDGADSLRQSGSRETRRVVPARTAHGVRWRDASVFRRAGRRNRGFRQYRRGCPPEAGRLANSTRVISRDQKARQGIANTVRSRSQASAAIPPSRSMMSALARRHRSPDAAYSAASDTSAVASQILWNSCLSSGWYLSR